MFGDFELLPYVAHGFPFPGPGFQRFPRLTSPPRCLGPVAARQKLLGATSSYSNSLRRTASPVLYGAVGGFFQRREVVEPEEARRLPSACRCLPAICSGEYPCPTSKVLLWLIVDLWNFMVIGTEFRDSGHPRDVLWPLITCFVPWG
jgi:hypothetical protein